MLASSSQRKYHWITVFEVLIVFNLSTDMYVYIENSFQFEHGYVCIYRKFLLH